MLIFQNIKNYKQIECQWIPWKNSWIDFWGYRRGAGADAEAETSAQVPRLEVLGRDGHDPEDPPGVRRWESAVQSARLKHSVHNLRVMGTFSIWW